ncbi:MAG: 3-phosphoshikimate 1-carboxyvinyltransferase [Candidatus Dormibacteria bacterium]
MIRTVDPAERLRGTLRVPGDKSISHRALMLNSVAEGTAVLEGVATGLDVQSTRDCLTALGAQFHVDGDRVTVEGVGLRGLHAPAGPLDCGNSGTTLRLLTGLLAGYDFETTLTGDESLGRRPMERVAEPLRLMGAMVQSGTAGGAPVMVEGGDLRGIDYTMPVASAQVKSAILLAALNARGTTIVGERLPSRNHTEIALLQMGADLTAFSGTIMLMGPARRLRACSMTIPGDISSAAFWLAAAAAHPDSEVRVEGVGLNPTRTGILRVLETMGADVTVEPGALSGGEARGAVTVRPAPLGAISISAEMIPHVVDEIPVIAVIATQAAGTTRITGAGELRLKESDRITMLATELKNLGAEVSELADGLEVRGPTPLYGAAVDAHGDHRLAMALAVAGLLAESEVSISGAESASVSYPGFWDDLREIVS